MPRYITLNLSSAPIHRTVKMSTPTNSKHVNKRAKPSIKHTRADKIINSDSERPPVVTNLYRRRTNGLIDGRSLERAYPRSRAAYPDVSVRIDFSVNERIRA